MRILAIDPGFERVGIAILEKKAGKESLLYSACFKTSAKLAFEKRLSLIGTEIAETIKTYVPDRLAIETLFFNSNQKTAMRVAEARGVIIYEAVSQGLSVYEYTPLQVKTAVAGYGKADKNQVARMAEKILGMETAARHDDETDAIALGITCLASEKTQGRENISL